MPSLLTSLRQQFPCERTAFGYCLIVPARLFKAEWQPQLENLGCKTFMQSWNGESCVFIQLEKPNSTGESNAADKFRKHWSHEEVQALKEFVSEGLDPASIAEKLGRTRLAVIGKIRRLRLLRTESMQSTASAETNQITLEDDDVKEFLSACSLLYPKHRRACAFLLKECINKILGGETKF